MESERVFSPVTVMTKTFLTTVILLIAASTYSQADGIYSMYWNNHSYFNPAVTEVDYRHHAYYSHHQNWWDQLENLKNKKWSWDKLYI